MLWGLIASNQFSFLYWILLAPTLVTSHLCDDIGVKALDSLAMGGYSEEEDCY